MLKFVVATAAVLALLTNNANARSTTKQPDLAGEFCGSFYCGRHSYAPLYEPFQKKAAPERRCSHHGCQEARKSPKRAPEHATQIVGRPEVCPARAYCGCATALKVFGKPVRELYLAANWFKFPRTEPAPGMVAVRQHHVFVIEKVLDGNMVLAYDPNSGGHQTRIHVRSLVGFSVRNPHGSRYAQN